MTFTLENSTLNSLKLNLSKIKKSPIILMNTLQISSNKIKYIKMQ